MYEHIGKKNNPLCVFSLETTDISDYLLKYSLSIIEGTASEEMRKD